MTAHTCVVTAPAGGIAPACVACGERLKAKLEAEGAVLSAARAFYRRKSLTTARLIGELDAAVGKLVALGDF
jgi:hypothetical protein